MENRTNEPKTSKARKEVRAILDAYLVIDNDLARDNIKNDLSTADFQDP